MFWMASCVKVMNVPATFLNNADIAAKLDYKCTSKIHVGMTILVLLKSEIKQVQFSW
jgi:hypothetical protein